MSRIISILLLLSTTAFADDTNTVVQAEGVDAFAIVWKRNIFDPNRARDGEKPPAAEPEHVPVTDSFTLLGSMSYEKGSFAFFDGSSSDYRKTLQPGGKIGGFTVAEIDPAKVILEGAEKKIEFPVGAQMKRHDKGEWKFNERSDYVPQAPNISASAPSSSYSSERRDYGGDRDRERRRERDDDDRDRDRSREFFRSSSSGITQTTTAPSTNAPTSSPSSSGDSAADVLRRLMQQREQELKK